MKVALYVAELEGGPIFTCLGVSRKDVAQFYAESFNLQVTCFLHMSEHNDTTVHHATKTATAIIAAGCEAVK